MSERNLEKFQLVERSISKKYRKEIWNPFVEAVKKYQLIQSGDKIAVCISGGKDSMLMAVLMRMLQRFSEVPFEIVYLVMNPGYSDSSLSTLLHNAELLQLPVTVFDTDIFAITESTEQTPCYLCARMRRGHLYNKAKELGCNKIALGHHFSDVIETTMLGLLYGSQLQAMLPKLNSQNFDGMQLIRPLYCIHEDAINAWKRYNGLEFLSCACKVAERNHSCDSESGSKRQEIKLLIRSMKQSNPNVENSIFRAIHNVKLDTFISYSQDGEEHSFLDRL